MASRAGGFESWRKLHRRYDPYTAGRARSLLWEILSQTQMKLPELMGAIEKTEDHVRRHCTRRDAQVNAHNLAEDIRMSALEALLPDDLEKHVQLNRARLTSYGVLREEIKTYCGCRGHAARNVRQKGPSHTGGDDPMDIGAKESKDSKDSKDSTDRTKTRARTRTRTRLNVGIVDTTRKTVGARMTTKVVRRENTNPRMQMLTILTRNHQLLNQKLKLMISHVFIQCS